jgi:hypothetical protein
LVREAPAQPAPKHETAQHEPPPYPAEKARGGVIVLRTPWLRYVFIGALVLAFILSVLLRIFA